MTRSQHPALLKHLCGATSPPAPGESVGLCLELAADDGAVAFLAESLADDPRLNCRFLILANYFLTQDAPARNALAACEALGQQMVRELLWILAITDAMQPHATRSQDRLWKHSLLTATLCRLLTEHYRHPPHEYLLAAGMAHDVGHLLISGPAIERGVDWHTEHDRLVDIEPGPLPERNHCVIGGCLLEFWHAPRVMVETARLHHRPEIAGEAAQPLIALVRLADLIAEYVDAESVREELSLEEASVWSILQNRCGLKLTGVEQLLADVLIPAAARAERLAGLLS